MTDGVRPLVEVQLLMSVMPRSGSKRFSSSLSGFPAPGRLVVKEQRSSIGGGEEARRLLVWTPSAVSLTRREGPEEALYHLLRLLGLFPQD